MKRHKRTRRLTKRRQRKLQLRKKRIIEWTIYTGILIVVAFIAFLLVLGWGRQVNITGDAMLPTISNGDVVLVNRTAYSIRRPRLGDLVVIRAQANPSANDMIRRVVAVAGDEVIITDGKLSVNGEVIDTEGIGVLTPIDFSGTASTTFTIREGQFFVLGDNTANSIDSRMPDFGTIAREDIYGRPWFVLHGLSFGFIQ